MSWAMQFFAFFLCIFEMCANSMGRQFLPLPFVSHGLYSSHTIFNYIKIVFLMIRRTHEARTIWRNVIDAQVAKHLNVLLTLFFKLKCPLFDDIECSLLHSEFYLSAWKLFKTKQPDLLVHSIQFNCAQQRK